MTNQKNSRQVWLISLGLGGKRLVTRQESAALKMAQLFIGNGPALEEAAAYARGNGGRCVTAEHPAAIRRLILEAPEERIAVITDEDPGMAPSNQNLLQQLAEFHPVLFPGVSLSSYAAARFGVNCADAVYTDLRYREAGLPVLCRRNPLVMVRTDKPIRSALSAMARSGFGTMKVMVLENPAGEDERVSGCRLQELCSREVSGDAVYLFIRPDSMSGSAGLLKNREYAGGPEYGIASEIRAVALSRLDVARDDVVYVVGAGGGDAAIEAAAAAERGIVYAFETDEKALRVLQDNCAAHAAVNVRIISTEFPAALGHLLPPDAVLVRGCPESVIDLIQITLSRNPNARIVVLTDSLEKATVAASQMEVKKMEMEFLQLTSSRGSRGNAGHILSPGDTAFIISGRSSV